MLVALCTGSMLRRMKFIRVGLLQGDSSVNIISHLQQRLSTVNHASNTEAVQLHSDIPNLVAFADGNPRLLEVLLAADAAHKARAPITNRFCVSTSGLRQLLKEGLSQVGDFRTVLNNALCIATRRRDETLQWATVDLQTLLAELLCDVMTQRTHKRADTLMVGSKRVSHEELMGEGICYVPSIRVPLSANTWQWPYSCCMH